MLKIFKSKDSQVLLVSGFLFRDENNNCEFISIEVKDWVLYFEREDDCFAIEQMDFIHWYNGKQIADTKNKLRFLWKKTN